MEEFFGKEKKVGQSLRFFTTRMKKVDNVPIEAFAEAIIRLDYTDWNPERKKRIGAEIVEAACDSHGQDVRALRMRAEFYAGDVQFSKKLVSSAREYFSAVEQISVHDVQQILSPAFFQGAIALCHDFAEKFRSAHGNQAKYGFIYFLICVVKFFFTFKWREKGTLCKVIETYGEHILHEEMMERVILQWYSLDDQRKSLKNKNYEIKRPYGQFGLFQTEIRCNEILEMSIWLRGSDLRKKIVLLKCFCAHQLRDREAAEMQLIMNGMYFVASSKRSKGLYYLLTRVLSRYHSHEYDFPHNCAKSRMSHEGCRWNQLFFENLSDFYSLISDGNFEEAFQVFVPPFSIPFDHGERDFWKQSHTYFLRRDIRGFIKHVKKYVGKSIVGNDHADKVELAFAAAQSIDHDTARSVAMWMKKSNFVPKYSDSHDHFQYYISHEATEGESVDASKTKGIVPVDNFDLFSEFVFAQGELDSTWLTQYVDDKNRLNDVDQVQQFFITIFMGGIDALSQIGQLQKYSIDGLTYLVDWIGRGRKFVRSQLVTIDDVQRFSRFWTICRALNRLNYYFDKDDILDQSEDVWQFVQLVTECAIRNEWIDDQHLLKLYKSFIRWETSHRLGYGYVSNIFAPSEEEKQRVEQIDPDDDNQEEEQELDSNQESAKAEECVFEYYYLKTENDDGVLLEDDSSVFDERVNETMLPGSAILEKLRALKHMTEKQRQKKYTTVWPYYIGYRRIAVGRVRIYFRIEKQENIRKVYFLVRNRKDAYKHQF